MALVIFFLANAHLFSLIISVAFVLTYILNKKDLLLKQERKVLICATLIIITGWLLAAWSIIPPRDYTGRFMSYDTSGYFSGERILKTISVCLKGIFYIPDYSAPDHQFWNSLWYRALHLMPLGHFSPVPRFHPYSTPDPEKKQICLYYVWHLFSALPSSLFLPAPGSWHQVFRISLSFICLLLHYRPKPG